MKKQSITQFQGEYRWLSNFTHVTIQSDIYLFPSVEHAYMSEKSDSNEWKLFCMETINPGVVKKASHHVDLIKDWDKKKVEIMKGFLIQNFSQEPYRTWLIETGDKHISEGNMWGDCFWGVCLKKNSGQNMLGRLIMEVRDNLNKNKGLHK